MNEKCHNYNVHCKISNIRHCCQIHLRITLKLSQILRAFTTTSQFLVGYIRNNLKCLLCLIIIHISHNKYINVFIMLKIIYKNKTIPQVTRL